jgi:hypothetical protein
MLCFIEAAVHCLQLPAQPPPMLLLLLLLLLFLSHRLQVLGIFPTTIRRKILRQLYGERLKSCYLFHNTGMKFLDALMLGARMELFLPKVCPI